ncbi:HAMP domain-containing protein, partial [Demequina mangrovi]
MTTASDAAPRRGPRVPLMAQILGAFGTGVLLVVGVCLLALREVQALADDPAASVGAARAIILTALVAAVAGTSVIGLVLATRITRATRKLTETIEAAAMGRFTATAGLTSNDELGDMSAALDRTAASLRALIMGIESTATTLADSARSLTAANAEVGEGTRQASERASGAAAAADEVNRSVQAVASGAEQMGASIKEISHNANEAARVAAQATDVAESTNEKVGRLGASSQEIGEVIKV